MRNLLFVLVFISITVLGCGGNKSPLENCADERYYSYQEKYIKFYKFNLLQKPYKVKMTRESYVNYHKECEKERMITPKTFDAEFAEELPKELYEYDPSKTGKIKTNN